MCRLFTSYRVHAPQTASRFRFVSHSLWDHDTAPYVFNQERRDGGSRRVTPALSLTRLMLKSSFRTHWSLRWYVDTYGDVYHISWGTLPQEEPSRSREEPWNMILYHIDIWYNIRQHLSVIEYTVDNIDSIRMSNMRIYWVFALPRTSGRDVKDSARVLSSLESRLLKSAQDLSIFAEFWMHVRGLISECHECQFPEPDPYVMDVILT